MKILVTGGTGFIGSHLVGTLVRKGHDVRCLVRKTSSVENLQKLGVELVYGDITELDSLEKALSGIDVVCHLAGILGQWGVSHRVYWNINVKGTQNILQASLRQSVKRFIHCSSAGVVGPVRNPPANESYPYAPSNIYEQTKAESEKLVVEYLKKGLAATILRPEFVYGPGDMHLLPLFRTIQKRMFPIIGNGKSLLHPTYVDDVVQCFLLCLENEKAVGETYFVAGEAPVTVKELTSIIAEELKVQAPFLHIPRWLSYIGASLTELLSSSLPRRSGKLNISLSRFKKPLLTRSQVEFFTQHRAFDISKAKQELGYHPIELRQGIRQTIHWYQRNGYLPESRSVLR
jgi:nucleoside-diphosphate-sugar epimerase